MYRPVNSGITAHME